MVTKTDNNDVEHIENQIFEGIKEDLNSIQESLSEKKITVDEAKGKLEEINKRIQGTKLETKDKIEIGKAFEKLIKLERNIDETGLKNELEEIVNLLETLKKDLNNLEADVLQKHTPWQTEQNQNETQYTAEADKGRKESSDNLDSTINKAAEEPGFTGFLGRMMQKLNS